VLVAHRGTGSGVSKAPHELGEGGAGLGCEGGADVAKVVPVQVFAIGSLSGRVVDLVKQQRSASSGCWS